MCTAGLCEVVVVYVLSVLQDSIVAANRLTAQSGAETRRAISVTC